MLKRLFLTPPLAIARLGSSDTPLECFYWGPNDDRPRGTGKTTIITGETLTVAEDGTVSASTPTVIQFKDGDQFRPVCPFFELHGEWVVDGKHFLGAITPAVLQACGLNASQLLWTVRAGNLKPFHMTQNADCRIEANLELDGSSVTPLILRGVSPAAAKEPLVPLEHHIPLGSVRLTTPTVTFPEYRLRFTPAKGRFYGPKGFGNEWLHLGENDPDKGKPVTLPDDQLFLNPKSAWVGFVPGTDDPRTNPGALYAGEGSPSRASLGIVDDVCDAIIACSVPGSDVIPGVARVTVSPPDYAPDRRHLITVADALKDHMDRADVWDPKYVEADSTGAEVQDLLERIFETMGLANVDVFNNRVDVRENPARAFELGIPYKTTDHYAFPPEPTIDGHLFPITERGRQVHRRFVVLELFKDMLRERPGLIEQWIRPPVGGNGFFTKQMPPVMRDSSGGPLHLTRRQYDLLRNWTTSLQNQAGDNL